MLLINKSNACIIALLPFYKKRLVQAMHTVPPSVFLPWRLVDRRNCTGNFQQNQDKLGNAFTADAPCDA
jgi:hypothetical protein